jgi:hypothetical protein
VPIAIGPVSEVSVQWNAYLGRWLMMYLDEQRALVVLRSATALTGPWGGEQVVARGTDFPGLYGTFMHPWSSGPDLYFTMSPDRVQPDGGTSPGHAGGAQAARRFLRDGTPSRPAPTCSNGPVRTAAGNAGGWSTSAGTTTS